MVEKQSGNHGRLLRTEKKVGIMQGFLCKILQNIRYNEASQCTDNTTEKKSGRTYEPNTGGACSMYAIIS